MPRPGRRKVMPVHRQGDMNAYVVYAIVDPRLPLPPLYVGQTSHIGRRMAVHRATTEWLPDTYEVWLLAGANSRMSAVNIEAMFIREYEPIHNKTGKAGAA